MSPFASARLPLSFWQRSQCLLALLLLLPGIRLHAQPLAPIQPGDPKTDAPVELLVGVEEKLDDDALVLKLKNLAGEHLGRLLNLHIHHLRLTNGLKADAVIALLQALPEVTFAEVNGPVYPCNIPNDPDFSYQLNLTYVSTDKAWNIWQPRQNVVIAILDSGIFYNYTANPWHPDLTNMLLRNPSGVVVSQNFITLTGIASPPDQYGYAIPNDVFGHGTFVAGLAAAQSNNGIGVAGVAGWTGIAGTSDTTHIKIMPVKVLTNANSVDPINDNSGNPTYAGLVNGIEWAISHYNNDGAGTNGRPANKLVINMSLTIGTTASQAVNTAVQDAINAGAVVVAAAGNAGVSTSNYPAACNNVLSVAATDRNGTLTSYSNYGSTVLVAGPGGVPTTDPIVSTTNDGSYGYFQGSAAGSWGTSFAAPLVAGEAALLWAQNPGLTNAQIKDWITGRTDTVNPYTTGHTIAGGRINIYHALLGATGNVVAAPNLNQNGHPALLWQSPQTGILSTWALNNVMHYATGLIANTTGGTDWKVRASADFDADGMPDLLWQNTTTGDVYLWYLTTSATVSRTASVATAQPLNWKIVGVADFNLDGKPDILWQNTTNGDVVVWYMNGATNVGYNYLSSGGASGWTITGCADFNNDGHPDILLQNNSTGQGAVWYFTFNLAYSNPNVYLGYAYLSSASGTPLAGDVNWPQVAIADFNGDGKPDIVLQNVTTGEVVVWYMNNYSQSSYAYVVP